MKIYLQLPYLVLFICSSLACGQSPQPCQPCRLQVAPGAPVFSITFQETTGTGTAANRSSGGELVVERDGTEVQRLILPRAAQVTNDRQAFLGVDINFDGFLDIQVITARGATNAFADYWIYKPSIMRFVRVGNYPILVPDTTSKTLKSYEQNGDAGLAYAAKEYVFAGDRLQLIRSEVQEETGQSGVFRLTVQERVKGVLKVTSRKLVRAPAVPR